MEKDLEARIRRMSRHLGEEAIARALNMEIDLVRAVLTGDARKVIEEEKRPGVTVTQYLKPAFRQRVIYIARVKGGIGATTLALNLAWRVSEKARVLVIDTQASIFDQTVFSDLLDFARADPYSLAENGSEICELADNLHYLPYSPKVYKHELEQIVLEARQDYDAIIVDLPVVDNTSALKSAMVAVYLYGGGGAEGVRICRLAEESDKKAIFVSLVPKHPLSREAKWIYLPKSDRSGVFDARSPAGKAVIEIVGSIWGRELLESPREGLLGKILGK